MSHIQSEVAVEARASESTRVRKWLAILREMGSHGTRIVLANIDMAKLFWAHRPGTSIVRAIVAVIVVVIPFLMSWSSGHVIEGLMHGSSISSYQWEALGLAVALILMGALPLVVSVVDQLIDHWAFVYVQQSQVTKVPDLDPVTYSDPELKDKIQQVQERAVWRVMALLKAQIGFFRAIALSLIAGVMLFRFDAALCLLILAGMTPSMVYEGLHAYRQFKVDERQADWWRRFWEDRGNILCSKPLSYLQVFGAAHWFAGRFADQIATAIEEYDSIERESIWKRLLCIVIGMTTVVFAAYALIRSASQGQLEVAQFVFFLGALSLFASSLAEVATTAGRQLGQSLYVTGLQELLALESRTHFPERGKQPLVTSEGVSLDLRNVRFGYPQGAGKRQREVIKGLSLHVSAGQKVAFVGINGAGKTTLKSVIVRLFDPDSGEVLLGGVPMREVDRVTLRKTVACLPQSIQHYNLKVEEFIALSRAGEALDADRVRWAAKRSGASTFVEAYREQYAQKLGRDYKDTEEPSGGQLQKLALASLLYSGAALMVLDEPTAAIDPEAARDFWDTLFHETPGQTVIFSTHYLGAVRRADRIVVLDEGQVLDQGKHLELMERCEAYRKLFESQARDYRT
ncbi:MAG: ABC transporter ATP-binding protein [Deltaproteobacteria bacterium]|nr:ABC transporter ATP-binding protein [Deltaproteobacteria bacterium]